ncbi:MAG: DNA polymerase III subunit gamma/tau [Spirosomataceae bacterium]
MEQQFIVSARKYRPITFESVVGQSHITQTLKNAIRTNHLAQAFLFCGPRGVGKTTCARILAKTINCQRLDEHAEPCGECESCVSFQNNASFNIHELDAASNNSVEDIRNLIDQVRYPPQVGHKKVYIIDEVHMLSTAAFNAFLKTLEEPPSYAIFILATTEKHKILPTILSRCQIFDFNRIQIKDIADHLAAIAQKEGISGDYEALELIAQKADGGLRDALSMFDLNVTFSKDNTLRYADVLENLHILDYDYYFRMTEALLGQQLAQVLVLFDEILQKGFDGQQFLVGLLEHFRNLMVCKDAITVRLLQVSERVQRQYLDQAQRAPLSFLLSALSVGSQCDINYKQAKNQRLHVEICLSKLAHVSAVVSPVEIAAVEKKNDTVAPVHSESIKSFAPPAIANPTTTVQAAPITPPPPIPTVQSRLQNNPNLSKLKSTISLEMSVQAEEKTLVTAEPEVKLNKPYTLAQLQATWKSFAQQREATGKASELIILDRDISLIDNVIQLPLDNPLQLDLLNDLRPDLMGYLRDKLQNTTIQIHAFVAPQETKYRPYTQAEKFAYLAEKNPALLELKNTLGLDFEY